MNAAVIHVRMVPIALIMLVRIPATVLLDLQGQIVKQVSATLLNDLCQAIFLK